MTHSLFISYSRQEAPFVSILLKALEGDDIQTWVDFQSLIPGRPWLDQILEGIDTADIVLLVVSKSSMASENVEMEYQHALEKKKRILLVIFEAVTLPSALQSCEWIDFRSSFSEKYKHLLAQIGKPAQQTPPPQTGFKTSFIVWFTFLVSLIALVISIPSWWTIFVPALLIPLPARILRRDFHFYRVRFALLVLPVVLLLSWVFFLSYQFTNFPLSVCLVTSFITTPILLLLLSSRDMRAWGRPSASAPRRMNPYVPNDRPPVAVPFFIEYAPEDIKYAEAIIKGLKKYGHPQVDGAGEAQVSFAVISHYKNTTSIDPEKQIVFPIIVQDTVIEDVTLQRIQWIDFRRGLRNLKSLALLLPEPAKLMKALGVVPISGQVVYPRIIQMLDYFLTLLAFFSISIWIPLWLEFGRQFLLNPNFAIFLTINIILSAMVISTVFTSRNALVNRKGRQASLGRLIGSILWVGFIGLNQTVYIINIIISLTTDPLIASNGADMRGSAILFLPLSFALGLILIGLFGIWNWGDLTRWFPQRQKQKK